MCLDHPEEPASFESLSCQEMHQWFVFPQLDSWNCSSLGLRLISATIHSNRSSGPMSCFTGITMHTASGQLAWRIHLQSIAGNDHVSILQYPERIYSKISKDMNLTKPSSGSWNPATAPDSSASFWHPSTALDSSASSMSCFTGINASDSFLPLPPAEANADDWQPMTRSGRA